MTFESCVITVCARKASQIFSSIERDPSSDFVPDLAEEFQ